MQVLKPEIRVGLRILQPAGISQVMKLAITVDENQHGRKGTLLGSATALPAQNFTSLNRRGGPIPNENLIAPKPPDQNIGRQGQFKRLTGVEMAEKRAKGLCFRCDERFTSGHRCNSRTLQVLIMDDETDEGIENTSGEEEEENAHLDTVEVSLSSVAGLTPPHTMKLQGIVGGIKVIVLIDSGATHNFMSPRILSKLGLHVTPDVAKGVILGNGKLERS